MVKLNEKHQKKHEEYKKELDKKVQILRELLDSENIMYIDLSNIVQEIEMLKYFISSNEINNNIEYNNSHDEEE